MKFSATTMHDTYEEAAAEAASRGGLSVYRSTSPAMGEMFYAATSRLSPNHEIARATSRLDRSSVYASYVDRGEWYIAGTSRTVPARTDAWWQFYLAPRAGSGNLFAHLHVSPHRDDFNQTSIIAAAVFVHHEEYGSTLEGCVYRQGEGFGEPIVKARKADYSINDLIEFCAEMGSGLLEEFEGLTGHERRCHLCGCTIFGPFGVKHEIFEFCDTECRNDWIDRGSCMMAGHNPTGDV